MRIIFRYMFKQLFVFLLAVSASLTLVMWLERSLGFIDLIVNDGLPVTAFLHFVVLLAPYFLVVVLPVATFCTVLFVYNKLDNDQELVVLRACGFSQVQLAKPGIAIGLVAMVLVYAINLYFLPATYREFKDLKTGFAQNLTPFILKKGQFNTFSGRYTIFFENKDQTGVMHNILVHDSSNPKKEATFLAATGALVRDDNELKAILWKASRQDFDPETGRMSIAYSDQYILAFDSVKANNSIPWRKPRERFLNELLFPDLTDPQDQRNQDKLRAAGHYYLASPLYTLTMAFIAMASLLAGRFERRGNLKRLLAGAAVMGLVMMSLFFFKDLTEKNYFLVPLLYLWPSFLIMASGYILLRAPTGEKQKQIPGQGGEPA